MIASETPETQEEFLKGLSDLEIEALPWLWEFWAHEHQVPPAGAWRSWVILGGRGAGKTRAGAEWIRSEVEGSLPTDPGRRKHVALIAETYDQARDVMVFGESGILACSPPDRRPEWLSGRRKLVWPNGAEATCFSASDPEALRGPQFDCAWADELGCAAIDKGTNQPNKFLDPKSSESSIPWYSNGLRDPLIQLQYLRAMFEYWGNVENNPVSEIYDAPMVDMAHAHVWAWDARPYPAFPARDDVWADADNYDRGHWITGRATGRNLGDVVAEICERSGVSKYDVSNLHGFVRGYQLDDVSDARAAIQPLMLAYGFDVAERDGMLRFFNRTGVSGTEINEEHLVRPDNDTPSLTRERAAAAEISGRVQLTFVDGDGEFGVAAVEAVFPDGASDTMTSSDLTLALTRSEARVIAERWLMESLLARDTAQLVLPPSMNHIGVGDVVAVPEAGGVARYRIDRIEDTELRRADAVRVEPGVYEQASDLESALPSTEFVPPLPVYSVFMDLPLMAGEEIEHAPHIAATSDKWPGGVAVYSSVSGAEYGLLELIPAPSILGEVLEPLGLGPCAVLDRANTAQVRLTRGTLSSITDAALLAGGNLAAIGDGSPENWELIQFQNASLIGEDTWELSGLLRGQAGSASVISEEWPSGSVFVLLDGTPQQLQLPSSSRNVSQTYRIGPSDRTLDDASYTEKVAAFRGIGLKPFAPVHLAAREAGGDQIVSWIRQTRIDGDIWDVPEVPLGETSEAYRIRIVQGEILVREETVSSPEWTYSAELRAEDALTGSYEIRIAQISEKFGAGSEGVISLD
ncbi:MAG: phage tail protein [Pseudomonadota bacterium]